MSFLFKARPILHKELHPLLRPRGSVHVRTLKFLHLVIPKNQNIVTEYENLGIQAYKVTKWSKKLVDTGTYCTEYRPDKTSVVDPE